MVDPNQRLLVCYQTPPQLKERWLHLIRLDQTDAEDTDGVLARFGKGEGGERCRGNEAGLEEDLVVRREDGQPQIHGAGDAGVVEVEGVTGGGIFDFTLDIIARKKLLSAFDQLNIGT